MRLEKEVTSAGSWKCGYHLGCSLRAGGLVVCSACGYENKSGLRFCGMCGTPLPHRPLTTPGAQNTWNLTRLPLENSSRAESRPNSSLEEPSPRTSPAGVVVEKPEPEPAAHDLSEKTAERVIPASVSHEPLGPPPSAAVTDAAPPHEMVPGVSLNEYVSGFRYVLQGQAEEITTKGENPGLGREVPAPA